MKEFFKALRKNILNDIVQTFWDQFFKIPVSVNKKSDGGKKIRQMKIY